MILSPKRLLVFLFIVFVMGACKKEEVVPPAPVEPAVVNKTIIKLITPAEGSTVDIFAFPKAEFNFPINKSIAFIAGGSPVRYKPVVDLIQLGNVPFTLSWNGDSTQVTLLRTNALEPATNYQLNITVHWEQYVDKAWKIVTWNNVEIKEVQSVKFTSAATFTLPPENIEYTYPIANQYHFLIAESKNGFIKLKSGQSALFGANYDNWVEFSTLTTTVQSPLSYSANKITFPIPQTLDPETIYKVKFVNKNKTTGTQTVMLQYAIRTSKYKTFLEKINSLSFVGSTLRGLHIPFRVHYLLNDFVSGEYFDELELQTGKLTIKSNQDYDALYSNNLLEFEAITSGNSWFDNSITPLIYSPWTESSFKPTLSRDTSLVGRKPRKAMYILSAGVKLSQQMVDSNNAPFFSPTGVKRIVHNVAAFCFVDFSEYQQQTAAVYLSRPPVPTREDKLIWAQFPIIEKGDYKFKIKYRLPDGSITSTSQMYTFTNTF